MSDSEFDPSSIRRGWMDNALVKLAALGFLGLLLLVPVGFVLGLVRERESRLTEVQASIAATWGQQQTLAGPVLALPLADPQTSRVLLLPAHLTATGQLTPERRSRGIFDAAVYTADLQLRGSFAPPDLDRLGLSEDQIRWDQARVLLSISDPHALTRGIAMTWDGKPIELEVAEAEPSLPGHTLSTRTPIPAPRSASGIPFALELPVRGTGRFAIAPLGASTELRLAAPWPSPAYIGGYLPTQHAETADDFEASWQVTQVSRPYPQVWRTDRVDAAVLMRAIEDTAAGVTLTIPADAYQQTERAAKYSILFIALTFGTFLLCELATRDRLHPIQYLLVGAALCLYYLLLLSLTEHLGFKASYWLSSAATILLISGYARAILASRKLALTLLGWLTLLYGYLYFILQLEDYALLAGALGLFVILATFMWTTRHLDWYSLTYRPQKAAS